MRHIPNAMTILRMLLLVPLGYLMLQSEWLWVFWIFVAAGLSDLLDGALARHFHWESPLGSFIDPMADKVLCGGIVLLLAWLEILPIWVTVLVVVRELLIVGGMAAYRILFGSVEADPLLVSKINTGVLIAVLVLVLSQLAQIPLIEPLANLILEPWGFGILAVLTVTSGAAYVVVWGRRARTTWKNQKIAKPDTARN